MRLLLSFSNASYWTWALEKSTSDEFSTSNLLYYNNIRRKGKILDCYKHI